MTTAGVIITKQFKSSRQLDAWLANPLHQKIYKVLYVDKTANTLKLEGKLMSPL